MQTAWSDSDKRNGIAIKASQDVISLLPFKQSAKEGSYFLLSCGLIETINNSSALNRSGIFTYASTNRDIWAFPVAGEGSDFFFYKLHKLLSTLNVCVCARVISVAACWQNTEWKGVATCFCVPYEQWLCQAEFVFGKIPPASGFSCKVKITKKRLRALTQRALGDISAASVQACKLSFHETRFEWFRRSAPGNRVPFFCIAYRARV